MTIPTRFICNASVIFAAIYRLVRKYQGEDVSDLTGGSRAKSGAKSGAFATATIGGTRMGAKSNQQASYNKPWQSQPHEEWDVQNTRLSIPLSTKQQQDSFLDMQRNSAYVEDTHKVALDTQSWNSSANDRIDKVGEASFVMYAPGRRDPSQ